MSKRAVSFLATGDSAEQVSRILNDAARGRGALFGLDNEDVSASGIMRKALCLGLRQMIADRTIIHGA